MNVQNIQLSRLHNAEHFEFHADVLALFSETNPAVAKFAAQLTAYKAVFAVEDEIMKQIVQSSRTARIAEADAARDEVFRSLVANHKSSLHHFIDDVRKAAEDTLPVFRTFGDLTGESLAKQSADTYNMIQELRTKHAEDVITLGLPPWLKELEKLNKIVEDLMRSRDTENAERPAEDMKTVRRKVDDAYRPLTVCLEALAIMETGDTAAALTVIIARLNATIERYNNAMAIRRGRAAAKKEKEEEL